MQRKLFLLSGVAFVVLVLVAVVGIGGSTPGSNASGEKLASFYNEHDVRQFVGSFVLALTGLFVVLFGVGLAATGARDGGRQSSWRYVLLIGTGLASAGAILTAFIHFALANGGDEKISPAAMQALNALDANTWVFFNTALGVMLVGAAGVILAGVTSRWLGWVALVLGVAIFIPFVDFFALLATLLWIAVASIELARSEAGPAYVPAPGAA
jgi:hypothetical protein